jgi:hypothetical protein
MSHYDELFDESEESIEHMNTNQDDINYEEYVLFSKKNYKNNKNIIEKQKFNKIGYFLKSYDDSDETILKHKKEYIKFYRTSYIPGSYIKNAINGQYYDYLVGSINENLLFKISIPIYTHEKEVLNYESSLLFYDSPEECEKHLCIKISQQNKKNWFNKLIKSKIL